MMILLMKIMSKQKIVKDLADIMQLLDKELEEVDITPRKLKALTPEYIEKKEVKKISKNTIKHNKNK